MKSVTDRRMDGIRLFSIIGVAAIQLVKIMFTGSVKFVAHQKKIGLLMNSLINCGERKIQTHSRIALTDICTRHGILEGDAVEVFIRKTEHKSSACPK